jgi:hypothetical protein
LPRRSRGTVHAVVRRRAATLAPSLGTAPVAAPIAVATYDPATGDDIVPDGRRYTQADLAHPQNKTRQSLLTPPPAALIGPDVQR